MEKANKKAPSFFSLHADKKFLKFSRFPRFVENYIPSDSNLYNLENLESFRDWDFDLIKSW